jgi:hypothetical protein
MQKSLRMTAVVQCMFLFSSTKQFLMVYSIKNDQDGLFEHVFTNKQAFIVFLQYMISASADPDFIPMMVDSEKTGN